MGVRDWVWVSALLCVCGCAEEQGPRPAGEVGQAIPAEVRSSTAAPAQSALTTLAAPIAVLDVALASQAAGPAEETPAFQGTAPGVLPESSRKLDRRTPESLLSGALAAMAGKDVAALARLSVDRPGLTQDDAAAAERRFLASAVQPYWKRVKAAVAAGAYTVEADGDRAHIDLEVGGAAGRYRIRLQKRGAGWYLAD